MQQREAALKERVAAITSKARELLKREELLQVLGKEFW